MSKILIPRLRDVLFIAILIGAIVLGPRMLNTDNELRRLKEKSRYTSHRSLDILRVSPR